MIGSDQFMTPPDELERARTYMGGIDIDPASSFIAVPYVKPNVYAVSEEEFHTTTHIPHYIPVFIDGLSIPWYGNVWLNPPYSKGLIEAFVNKAIDEWNTAGISRMLVLVNSATDTQWYHKLLANSTRVFQYRGRLKFWKMFDGAAHEKWQGQKNKDDIAAGITNKVKIGNQPRFLNTLFLFESDKARLPLFYNLYKPHGTILTSNV